MIVLIFFYLPNQIKIPWDRKKRCFILYRDSRIFILKEQRHINRKQYKKSVNCCVFRGYNHNDQNQVRQNPLDGVRDPIRILFGPFGRHVLSCAHRSSLRIHLLTC